MRRKFIAGNWKMNGRMPVALTLVQSIINGTKQINGNKVEVVLFPPVSILTSLASILKGSSIFVGGQDCHTAAEGAHTGDISAGMLRDAGASYVLVGHSERRQNHHESDQIVALKAKAAWDEKLTVIYCIGESLEERKAGKTLSVIEAQLSPILEDGVKWDHLIIAYEPIWAIGTGLTASPEQAEEVHAYIRNLLSQELGKKIADQMLILYGGSMKPDNAKGLLSMPNIDGGLIGGASLKAEDFMAIIHAAQEF